MNSLGKRSVQIVLIAIGGYILQYLCHLYLANSLSPSDYGDFAVAVSLALLLTMFVELGASKTIPKYIPEYQSNDDISRISGILRGYIILTFLLSVFIAVIGSFLGYLDLDVTHKIGSNELHPLVLVLWFLPFMALSKFFSSLLKCFDQFVISEILYRMAVFALLFVFLWIFKHFGFKENDWSGVALFGVSNIIVLGAYLFFVTLFVPLNYIKTNPLFEWREWLNASLPIMLSVLFFLGMKQIDLFMVELLSSDESSVGYFSAASQTAQGILVIYTSLNLMYAPFIGKAILQNSHEVKKVLSKMTFIVIGFCLFFLSVLVFFGKPILHLFGASYTQAYAAMVLLAIGLSVNAIVGGYITFLQYIGKQNQVLIVQLIALVLAIALNAILIPKFGITGAALASSAALTLLSLFLLFSAMRALSTKMHTMHNDFPV